MIIGGYRVGTLAKGTAQAALKDNVLGLGAQTAYFFFFSLFPLLLFATPLIGIIGNAEAVMSWVMTQLEATVPQDALSLVEGVVEEVVFAPGAPGLVSIGALLALWAGSNIFNQLTMALNRAYNLEESRPYWKRRLIAMAAVIVAGFVVFLSAMLMLVGPEIARWIGNLVEIDNFATIWIAVQYPLVFLILVCTFWGIYYFLPNLRQDRKQVIVGALFATVAWLLVTFAFRFYVQNFGNYSATYGTIGAVIVLLMWMYLTMLVTLLGGELNSQLHRGTGRAETRRGVVYAGRIATAADPTQTSTERA
jgi:membrane protein